MNIQIGLTDLCNYSCVMCMQQSHKGLYGKKEIRTPELHKGEKGFISPNLFHKILKEVSDYEIELLKMQWLGESFLHPQIVDLINILSKFSNFKRIVFTTNMSIMNENIIKELKKIKCEVQFVFSLDSFEKNTYKKIKGIDNIYRVKKNINMLMREIPENIYTFQSIVMNENDGEHNSFIKTCEQEFGVFNILWDEEKIYRENKDHIFFKKLGAYHQKRFEDLHTKLYSQVKNIDIEELDKRLITSNSVFEYDDPNRGPCPAPFRTPTFNWDGTMVYCCMDSFLEQTPGNIKHSSFKELWYGEYSKKIRRSHLNKEFKKYPRCARCGNLDVKRLGEKEIEVLN